MKPLMRILLSVVAVMLSAPAFGCGVRPSSTTTDGSDGGATRTISGSPASSTVATPAAEATPSARPVVFAVIGDYGSGDAHERAVARLVRSWRPSFIITTGDDYYKSAGGQGIERYKKSTGAFYGRWLPAGGRFRTVPSPTTSANSFYPTPGNHDYSDAGGGTLKTYLAYFALPGDGGHSSSGTERYYDFVRGPVHFFALNSNPAEPSGTSRTSRQAAWLRSAMASSKSPWQLVYDHHPPYSSDSTHGSTRSMRWPFAEWGADAILSGHAHTYERVSRDGIVYFVNGLGGASRYGFGAGTRLSGSRVRYSRNWGAQRVTATPNRLLFEFFSADGALVDSCLITR